MSLQFNMDFLQEDEENRPPGVASPLQDDEITQSGRPIEERAIGYHLGPITSTPIWGDKPLQATNSGGFLDPQEDGWSPYWDEKPLQNNGGFGHFNAGRTSPMWGDKPIQRSSFSGIFNDRDKWDSPGHSSGMWWDQPAQNPLFGGGNFLGNNEARNEQSLAKWPWEKSDQISALDIGDNSSFGAIGSERKRKMELGVYKMSSDNDLQDFLFSDVSDYIEKGGAIKPGSPGNLPGVLPSYPKKSKGNDAFGFMVPASPNVFSTQQATSENVGATSGRIGMSSFPSESRYKYNLRGQDEVDAGKVLNFCSPEACFPSFSSIASAAIGRKDEAGRGLETPFQFNSTSSARPIPGPVGHSEKRWSLSSQDAPSGVISAASGSYRSRNILGETQPRVDQFLHARSSANKADMEEFVKMYGYGKGEERKIHVRRQRKGKYRKEFFQQE